MSTFQTMKFTDPESGNKFEFSEAFTAHQLIRVYLNNGSSGSVDMNRDNLVKLRNFLTLQISKLKKP